jgi:SAM-dependent methyltransferase
MAGVGAQQPGRSQALTAAVASAYSAAGASWSDGPARVYAPLAGMLCDRLTVPVAGARALDVGSGTGAAGTLLALGGAHVVAVDIAVGMLAARIAPTVPAVAADVTRLPLRSRAFDVAVAAFSLNHVRDPVAALAELRRVLRPGGGAVVGVYAERDAHPAKRAVEEAAVAAGWSVPPWYARLRAEAMPRLATVPLAEAAASAAGIHAARAFCIDVPLAHLDVDALVAWRAGMPHLAPFMAALAPADRRRVVDDARSRVGDDVPPLVRSVIVLRWPDPPGGARRRSSVGQQA